MPLDPIVAEVVVPTGPAQAFIGFTAQMGEWWDPGLTMDPPTFASIEIDPEGEVATIHDDGQRHVFGRVMTWDPLGNFAQEFWLGHPDDEATTLDVRFTDEGSGTRVRLVHAGWFAGSEDLRATYARWPELLQRYASHVS